MALNLSHLPAWRARLSVIEQRLAANRPELHDMIKWRLQVRRLVTNMAAKMREVGFYLKAVGVERADVPLPEVKKLLESSILAYRELNCMIAERDGVGRNDAVASHTELVSGYPSPIGPSDSSDQFRSGPSNFDLAALFAKLTRD